MSSGTATKDRLGSTRSSATSKGDTDIGKPNNKEFNQTQTKNQNNNAMSGNRRRQPQKVLKFRRIEK